MQPVLLDDPAWQTTFPHRVTPLHEEWLAGLLLRCDEVNHWASGPWRLEAIFDVSDLSNLSCRGAFAQADVGFVVCVVLPLASSYFALNLSMWSAFTSL
jgi:hypothetical protein